MRAHVVIGANYGDEGKGLMTDYLVRRHNIPLVIRYNGGAQAGHTVVTPEGDRHVFHHFGSGTLAGAATYLDLQFISNPILFNKERKELRALGVLNPIVYVHPNSRITTPYDMLLNQAAEMARSDKGKPHGSVGVGIYETIHRTANFFPLFVSHLSATALEVSLSDIVKKYVPDRAEQLGILPGSRAHDFLFEYVNSRFMAEEFISDCDEFARNIALHYPVGLLWKLKPKEILFESAQGLALSENNAEDFPYLTPSNPGVANVLTFLGDVPGLLDESELLVTYVTRGYLTRHGAGPLPYETKPPEWLKDETNLPHDFQGTLRYAPLTALALEKMRVRLDDDSNLIPMSVKSGFNLAVTCLDQMDIGAEYAESIANAVATDLGYCSFGPKSSNVLECRGAHEVIGEQK